MNIQGSVALVTGANRGLGRAFAQALLDGGAVKVYAAARDPSALTLPGVVPLRLDVTNRADIAAAVSACSDVTLLVNNAGIARPAPLLEPQSDDALRAQFETNVFGPLALSRAFAPVLARHGGGAIVNMLSVLSWLSIPAMGSYGASKSAAWALTNGLRNELRSQHTQVLGVHAAFIDTDMARNAPGPKTSAAEVARRTFAALEAGLEEVLIDDVTRQVKQGLVAERPVYLGTPG